MASTPETELLTPLERRLIPTRDRGIYRRGDRFVAITYYRGRKVKTTHDTRAGAKAEKARRDAGAAPTSRERFDRYVERWLVEYTGRSCRGLRPHTRAAYASMLRNYAVPYFGRQRLGDIGPRDIKLFIVHLSLVEPRHSQRAARRFEPRDHPAHHVSAKSSARGGLRARADATQRSAGADRYSRRASAAKAEGDVLSAGRPDPQSPQRT